MPTLGAGFGRDLIVGSRPVVPAQQQAAYSLWYNRKHEEDERPEWLAGSRARGAVGPPASLSRMGEWKLVWKAKGESASADQVAENPSNAPGKDKVGNSVASTGNHFQTGSTLPTAPKKEVATNPKALKSGSATSRPASDRSSRSRRQPEQGVIAPLNFTALGIKDNKTKADRPGVKQSARSHVSNVSGSSGLSRSSTMSKCTLQTASSRAKRLGTARSGRSASSAGSYSSLGSSASGVEQREILKRIEGLEEALRTETALRQRMQTLLEHQDMQ